MTAEEEAKEACENNNNLMLQQVTNMSQQVTNNNLMNQKVANMSQQVTISMAQATVPPSPGFKKNLDKKNKEDGMDKVIIYKKWFKTSTDFIVG